MGMIIRSGTVFQGNGFVQQDLFTEGNRIAVSAEGEVIDAVGLYVIPGLVDIHVHGAAGYSFSAGGEGLQTFCSYEVNHGITSFCLTGMCLPEEKLMKMVEAVQGYDHPGIAGIRLEGPFLNAQRCGAQDSSSVIPGDAGLLSRLNKASGNRIRIVDTAPEVSGNMEFIREAAGSVCISIGHTAADYDTAKQAFAAGASHVTHLYNAMNPVHHRFPGPVIAAWEAGADVELICDGIHIHPAVVRMTFALFGEDRVIMVSDSMAGTGLPDGTYLLGGKAVRKTGSRVVLEERPDTLAGSVTDLYSCFRKAVLEMNIPLVSALKAVTVNPARSISLDAGSLEPGRYADLLLVDDHLEIKTIIHRGRIVQKDNKEYNGGSL